MKIGIVAGEASGDLLGSGLVAELKKLIPNASFEGIAGPKMIQQGVNSLYSMERLSVMGITEVLGRYTELYSARKEIIRHFQQVPIDLFIGIDAPDFNLGMEQQLHKSGIKTVHYVSPSVWAWRKYRVKKIARAMDLMLTLFPFEARFYEKHSVPVQFVGHPLGDIIPLESDKEAARQLLGLPLQGKIVAMLPGSRSNELQYLTSDFIKIANWCHQQMPGLKFVVPFANPVRRRQFQQIASQIPVNAAFEFFDGMAREVMAASDVVLLASGTAALEALLLKRPMVVAYRVSPLTYWIAKRLVTLKHYSLPNLLLREPVVPEFIQDEIIPSNVGSSILSYLDNSSETASLLDQFKDIHLLLRRNASVTAANAVAKLVLQS